MKKLLIVDDNSEIGDFIALVAGKMDFDVKIAQDGDSFKEAMTTDTADLVIMDLGLPRTDGIELMSWMASADLKVPVILISGMGVPVLEGAKEIGRARGVRVIATLAKPIFRETLVDALQAYISGE